MSDYPATILVIPDEPGIERLIINEVKKKNSLNQTELAKFLGIDPKTLRSKIK